MTTKKYCPMLYVCPRAFDEECEDFPRCERDHMKLVEPHYCPKCNNELSTNKNWCYECKTWRIGTRAVTENVSKLKFSYDDMGCYLERE